MHGAEREIDELDRLIAERCGHDGRESLRSLARALDVSEATVSARLQRLEQQGKMRVVAITDFEAFGYDHLAFVMVTVECRPPLTVAEELASLPSAVTVAVTSGRRQVVVVALARSRVELARVVGSEIPAVAGVARANCNLAVDLARFDSDWAALHPATDPVWPGPPAVGLDDLDTSILESLQRDARKSNRRIAAELGLTEGTVRSRVRRLRDEGWIRIQAVRDFGAFGPLATAMVGVNVIDGQIDAVQKGLLPLDEITVIARTLGEWDFVLVMAARSRPMLMEVAQGTIAALPGVGAVEIMEIVAAPKHVYTWARIRPPASDHDRT
jgi:DNA-binding Lrp family transcriptional regulator